MNSEKINQAELSLTFVTSQKIRALNKKYLHRSYATDVLAFDLTEGLLKGKKVVMGDIIISTDAAIQNARKFKTTPAYELGLYVIHGVLHLLGYDDHGPVKTKRMRKREEELSQELQKEIKKVIF